MLNSNDNNNIIFTFIWIVNIYSTLFCSICLNCQ
jgi:hypothetical protein